MLVRLFSHLFFDSVIRYFVSIPFSLKWFDVIDTVVNVNELELEKPSICIKWRILTANIIFEPHIHWQVVGNRRYVFKSLYFSFFFCFLVAFSVNHRMLELFTAGKWTNCLLRWISIPFSSDKETMGLLR